MRYTRLAILAIVAISLGCNTFRSVTEPRPDQPASFSPVAMRIHPIFSGLKDWTGDGRADGIEALVEFEDQFGDPTKASGTVIFELFSYRPTFPDPRGERLVNPWVGSLQTLADQQARGLRVTLDIRDQEGAGGTRTQPGTRQQAAPRLGVTGRREPRGRSRPAAGRYPGAVRTGPGLPPDFQ